MVRMIGRALAPARSSYFACGMSLSHSPSSNSFSSALFSSSFGFTFGFTSPCSIFAFLLGSGEAESGAATDAGTDGFSTSQFYAPPWSFFEKSRHIAFEVHLEANL